jgi:hypothetical protein
MTKFIVNIWAYNHHAKFKVESEDSPTDLEQSILDKLGENSIVEEVIDDTRPIQSKKVLGVEVGTGASI